MSEKRLRELLRDAEVPGERDAERRAWTVARSAFAERQEAPARPFTPRLLLAASAALIVLLALLSPAGAAIRDWVSDVVGQENARPALTSLPTRGDLLVDSGRGTWVVQADGSQRLLGEYREATWSPHGVYVAAARGPRLTALEADGDPRWTITGPHPVSMPSWQAPDGFRIAYLSGTSLRVVAGDGTEDHQIAGRVAPVAPAWRPGAAHILAFIGSEGLIRLADSDSGKRIRSYHLPDAGDLAWSRDGSRLAVATGSRVAVLRAPAPRVPEQQALMTRAVPNSTAGQVTFSPTGDQLAFIRRSPGGSELVLGHLTANGIGEHTLFSGPGHLTDPTWSPDGRWLLVGWREADQWLFIDTHNPSKVVAIANIARQFDPGGTGAGAFPRIAGWCCAP